MNVLAFFGALWYGLHMDRFIQPLKRLINAVSKRRYYRLFICLFALSIILYVAATLAFSPVAKNNNIINDGPKSLKTDDTPTNKQDTAATVSPNPTKTPAQTTKNTNSAGNNTASTKIDGLTIQLGPNMPSPETKKLVIDNLSGTFYYPGSTSGGMTITTEDGVAVSQPQFSYGSTIDSQFTLSATNYSGYPQDKSNYWSVSVYSTYNLPIGTYTGQLSASSGTGTYTAIVTFAVLPSPY